MRKISKRNYLFKKSSHTIAIGSLITLLVLALFFPPPISADEYEFQFPIPWAEHWKGNSADTGQTASGSYSSTTGKIELYTQTSLVESDAYSWVMPYYDFTYDNHPSHPLTIVMDYTIKGEMSKQGSGSNNNFKVIGICWVVAENGTLRPVGGATGIHQEDQNWSANEKGRVTFTVHLNNDQDYRLSLYTGGSCHVENGANDAIVDFDSDDGNHYIRLDAARMYYYFSTITQSDPYIEEDVKLVGEVEILEQDEYDSADGLSFVSYNTREEISSWKIKFVHFNNSTSSRVEGTDNEVFASAWGNSIPRGSDVRYRTIHWIPENQLNCTNTMGYRDQTWSEELAPNPRDMGKQVPDHVWQFEFPDSINVGGIPSWSHQFTIYNLDPVQELRIANLSFWTTDVETDEMTELPFFDMAPLEDFDGTVVPDFYVAVTDTEQTLLPLGPPLLTEVITPEIWYGKFIYVKYDLVEYVDAEIGDQTISKHWGCHLVTEEETAVPESAPINGVFKLHGNYPNPFNPVTEIAYNLAVDARVRLEVFDIQGRRVATLFEGEQTAGPKSVTWHTADSQGQKLSSGVYMLILDANGVTESRKMMLLK